ncbi:MAG: hypothetical protein KJ667_01260 [Alphaproteobacteria bacterium]|nr:hypothetical protein [Alphaproteobacteria bacterium]
MRKTLRALFLGSALTLSAGAAMAQSPGFIPMDNRPVPPSAEQQETYDLLKQLLQMETVISEPQIRTLEQLEDAFFGGTLPEADYRAQRAATLRAMYPELDATHEEFESRTNKIVGCTADGISMVVPVITFVNRGDVSALFNRLVGTATSPGSSNRYLITVTDLSNRLRQGIENSGKTLVNPFNTAALNDAGHREVMLNHLMEMGATAARDAQVGVEFRTLPAYEIDRACMTDAERAAEQAAEAEAEAARIAAAAAVPATPPARQPGPADLTPGP